MYVEFFFFFFFFFFFVWNYYFISARWLPPLRINKVKVKVTSEAKIHPVFFKSTGAEDLILPWSRVGHTLRPMFIL